MNLFRSGNTVTLELGDMTDPTTRSIRVFLRCFFIIFHFIMLNFSNLFDDAVINSRLFSVD